jgi:hypothetical protein
MSKQKQRRRDVAGRVLVSGASFVLGAEANKGRGCGMNRSPAVQRESARSVSLHASLPN